MKLGEFKTQMVRRDELLEKITDALARNK